MTAYPGNITVETKAWIVDAQLQGTVGGNILAFYTSYGVAAASDCSSPSGTPNLFNPGCSDKKSFNIGALYEAIPHLLFLEAGYRNARTSDPTTSTWYNTQLGGAAASDTVKDNAWELGGFIKPTQNSKIALTYAKFSGSLYSPTSGPFSDISGAFTAPLGYPNATAANGGGNGSSLFEIEGNIDF